MLPVKSQIDQQVFNSLNPEQKYFVSLRHETPLKELEQSTIKRLCLDVITVSFVEYVPNGQPDPKILQAQTELLYSELKGKFLTLTPSELKECFKQGIRGKYGEYFGMCPKTYNQFLEFWISKPERGQSWQTYLDKISGLRVAEKPQIDQKFIYDACEKAYKKYKERGEMPTVPFCLYDYIKTYTGEETLIDKLDWQDILMEGTKRYEQKLKHSALREIMKDAKLNMTEGHEDFNQVFCNSIKEVATRYYFDSLIKQGKDKIKE